VLIEKHRLIEVILKTLLKESERWKNGGFYFIFSLAVNTITDL